MGVGSSGGLGGSGGGARRMVAYLIDAARARPESVRRR